MYLITMIFIDRAREMTRLYCLGLGISAVLFFTSIFVGEVATIILWVVGLVVESVLIDIACRLPRERRLPVHVGHVAERHGLFIMIHLGESILQIVLPNSLGRTEAYIVALLGLIVAYNIHNIYFEAQPFTMSHHALRRTMFWSRNFVYLHMFLCPSLLSLGCGLKILIEDPNNLTETGAFVLGGSFAASISMIIVMRWTHRPDEKDSLLKRLIVLVVQLLLVALSVLISLAYSQLTPMSFVGILAIISSLLVVSDVFQVFRRRRVKHHQEKHASHENPTKDEQIPIPSSPSSS